jgi:hypothetical protein
LKNEFAADILAAALALLVFVSASPRICSRSFSRWKQPRNRQFLQPVLGDSSRMFANSFFVKADAYYHSGYYPTIFDNNSAFQTRTWPRTPARSPATTTATRRVFWGRRATGLTPLAAISFPTATRIWTKAARGDLSGSEEVREILPWLKLSAELDPENIQTYTVTAFWLRERMNKVRRSRASFARRLAQQSRQLRILFELGRLYFESYHDTDARAERLGSLRRKKMAPGASIGPARPAHFDNRLIFEQLATTSRSWRKRPATCRAAIDWEGRAKSLPHARATLQKQIDEAQSKKSARARIPSRQKLY